MKEAGMRVDVAVLGGGIAGLWSVNLLRRAGYNAVLIDSGQLGGFQSLASQGMIHGGQRYALQGSANAHSELLKDLPEVWNQCLLGSGPIDLSGVSVLAHSQYMWSPGALTSRVAAFFASKVMQSEVKGLPRPGWPAGLSNNCGRFGAVYELDEVVVDCHSLISELTKNVQPWCFRGTTTAISYQAGAGSVPTTSIISANSDPVPRKRVNAITVTENGRSVEVEAKAFVATAGLGNEKLRALLHAEHVQTQVRPLKQIFVKGAPFDLFAHCITTDPRPRATITTHYTSTGERLWYMGGLVGVYGVDKSDAQALQFAQSEMRALFPKVDWSATQWATLAVDRAEPKVASGFLPDGPATVEGAENFLFAWPTKMTFAPALGTEVLSWVGAQVAPPAQHGVRADEGTSLSVGDAVLPPAQVAPSPWELLNWSTFTPDDLRPTAF
jgi:hypothetical protein